MHYNNCSWNEDICLKIILSSLLYNWLHTCFKNPTIVPVPKKSTIPYLKDYLPIALTTTVMMCFMWIDRHLDFLRGRPQMDSTSSLTVSYLTLFTGAPQGCMLSHLLYSTANIYHHCRPYLRCWQNGLQEAAHSPGCWEPKQQPLLFLVAASLPDSAAVPLETAGTYIEWWSAELIGSRKMASQTGGLPEKSQVRWSSAKHLLCTLPTHVYAYFVFIFFFFFPLFPIFSIWICTLVHVV